jgi:hypothetical protein
VERLFTTAKSRTLPVFGLLCLALVVLFWPVFFQGKVLVPGDIPNTDPFLASDAVRPARPQNILLSDQIEQVYVGHRVAAQALQADGTLPKWNPYIFTGQPLLANAQSSLFYPPNLMLRYWSPGQVATLRIFVNLLFAGMFTFLFARELGISWGGALLAALSFAFSGPSLVWAGFPLANVLACLPFLLWSGEMLLKRRDPLRVALLGLGMGLSLVGGHPETTFQVLAVFSLYFLARLALAEAALREKGRLLAGYLLAVVLGGLLSGVQLVPFLDFMVHSSTFAHGGRASDAGNSIFYAQQWLANLATGFTLLCPNFFGNPLDRSYIWPFATFQNYNEQSVYFGVVPLALACAALCAGLRKKPLLILGVLALGCLAVAWHLPGFEAVSHLPIFSMAPNKRLRLPFVLLGAVLAGFGYDLVREQLRQRERRGRAGYGLLAVWLLVLALFVWIVSLKLTIGATVPPDTFRYLLLNSVFSFGNWRTYLPLAVALAGLAGYFLCLGSRLSERRYAGLLVGLVALELIGLGWGYNPAVREREILPPAKSIEFLKGREQQPYRILTTDGYFYPNFGAAYGIADVAGYDVPVYQRYSDLYLAQGGQSFGGQIDSRQMWDPVWPLVDFLNVKYVVSPRELNPDKFRPVYQGTGFRIYQNLKALPRAFLVYQTELAPDPKAALTRMLAGKVDLASVALLEEPLPPAQAGTLGPQAAHSVRFLSYGTDAVQLQVETPTPGFLMLSDLYTPDWKVSVEGKPAKLYRADYSYRGVYLPAGTHRVVFSYQPLSYRVGCYLSLAGIVLMLLVVLRWLRRPTVLAGGLE